MPSARPAHEPRRRSPRSPGHGVQDQLAGRSAANAPTSSERFRAPHLLTLTPFLDPEHQSLAITSLHLGSPRSTWVVIFLRKAPSAAPVHHCGVSRRRLPPPARSPPADLGAPRNHVDRLLASVNRQASARPSPAFRDATRNHVIDGLTHVKSSEGPEQWNTSPGSESVQNPTRDSSATPPKTPSRRPAEANVEPTARRDARKP